MSYKILLFMKRRPGMSFEAFKDYYENHHVPLALKYTSGVKRYLRRYLTAHPNPETGASDELRPALCLLRRSSIARFRAMENNHGSKRRRLLYCPARSSTRSHVS